MPDLLGNRPGGKFSALAGEFAHALHALFGLLARGPPNACMRSRMVAYYHEARLAQVVDKSKCKPAFRAWVFQQELLDIESFGRADASEGFARDRSHRRRHGRRR